MIGATIYLGAGNRSLVMQGHTWDLLNLNRNETSTLASMISDTMGLTTQAPRRQRSRARTIHN
jgi:hypothetical protein